ncbi:HEAT repeat domain-containing protein [Actinocatenispora sera]|uniref:HEAT repeat domain-containing protein n=1 Tax=Actinocatenispora sera TaxID=390989 RepID=UPI0033FD205C
MTETPQPPDPQVKRDASVLIRALRRRRFGREKNAPRRERIERDAAEALGDLGDQRALVPLRDWAVRHCDDLFLHGKAITSMGRIGGPAAADLLIGLLVQPPGTLTDAVSIGIWQASIARALAVVGDPRAIEPLTAVAYRSQSANYARTVTGAVREIGGPAAGDALLRLLTTPPNTTMQEMVLAHAVDDLGQLGEPRAVGPIAVWSRTEQANEYSGATIRSLLRIGGAGAVDALLDLIADPPATATRIQWQTQAATALGMLADQRALPRLQVLVPRLPQDQVRDEVITAIGAIGGPAAADILLGLLAEPPGDTAQARSGVTAAAARALGTAADPRALPTLQELVERSDDAGLRIAAVAGIGHVGGTAAADVLLRMVADPPLREAAAAALGGTGDPRALTLLLQYLHDGTVPAPVVTEALGRLGDQQAVEPLRTHLLAALAAPGEPSTTYASFAQALGALGDSSAVGPLRELLGSSYDNMLSKPTDAQFAAVVRSLALIGGPSAASTLDSLHIREPTAEQLKQAERSDNDYGYYQLLSSVKRHKDLVDAQRTVRRS